MAITDTLLCIHRVPDELHLLRQNGYELLIANNIGEGLQLVRSYPVRAIVLEHRSDSQDGDSVAAEIKKVQPQVPIVMLAEDIEFAEGALNGVDALAAKSDGPHFLLATIHSILARKSAQSGQEGSTTAPLPHPQDPGVSVEESLDHPRIVDDLSTDTKDAPFSSTVWQGIRDGRFRF